MQEDPQLKMLFDYTVFHIGLYVTLMGILIAALNLHEGEKPYLWLIVPIFLLFIAGACGGIVGSNIPEHKEYATFIKAEKWSATFDTWIVREHVFFWGAVVLTTLIFAILSATAKPNSETKKSITIQAHDVKLTT